MIQDFERAASTLLAGEGASSAHLAERAAYACEALSTHLSRLLGETGVRLMFKRSLLGATHRFPWLSVASRSDFSSSSLRDVLAQQPPAEITEAFVAVMSAFVALLERLIGGGLVERLLDEVWPGVFTHAAKDTP